MSFIKALGEQAAGAVTSLAGQGLGLLFGKSQDRRQLRQQEKLQALQMKGMKEMSDYQQQQQYDMWNKTNYGAQVEHLKKAGLNAGLLYGTSGGGGSTVGSASGAGVTGAAAGDPNAGIGMGIQTAAQIGLMNAQKENIEADTKQKEATTEGTGATTEATKWQTELSKKLNTDTFISDVQNNQKWAAEKIDNENTKWKADWEAYQAGAYDGKQWDDPSTPMAKAVRAGFEETVTNAQKAKAENNVAKAEAEIKGYEARLTRQGIAAGSPWYVKIMGDLLGKLGISLTGDTAENIKK